MDYWYFELCFLLHLRSYATPDEVDFTAERPKPGSPDRVAYGTVPDPIFSVSSAYVGSLPMRGGLSQASRDRRFKKLRPRAWLVCLLDHNGSAVHSLGS